MNRHRYLLLICLTGLFVILVGLIIWSKWLDSRFLLPPGTQATIVPKATAQPSLPPLRSNDPMRGSADAHALVLIEFADYSCQACHLLEPELMKAMSSTKRPVRLIWRDYVTNETPEGLLPATAARCANEQGKFWEMHDILLSASKMDVESLKLFAINIGLDLPSFSTCLTSKRYDNAIKEDTALAKNANIPSPPTLFLGGNALTGFLRFDELLPLIQTTPSS